MEAKSELGKESCWIRLCSWAVVGFGLFWRKVLRLDALDAAGGNVGELAALLLLDVWPAPVAEVLPQDGAAMGILKSCADT